MIDKDTYFLAEDLFAGAWAQANKITDPTQLANAAIEVLPVLEVVSRTCA
jgi:hypothetical protein